MSCFVCSVPSGMCWHVQVLVAGVYACRCMSHATLPLWHSAGFLHFCLRRHLHFRLHCHFVFSPAGITCRWAGAHRHADPVAEVAAAALSKSQQAQQAAAAEQQPAAGGAAASEKQVAGEDPSAMEAEVPSSNGTAAANGAAAEQAAAHAAPGEPSAGSGPAADGAPAPQAAAEQAQQAEAAQQAEQAQRAEQPWYRGDGTLPSRVVGPLPPAGPIQESLNTLSKDIQNLLR